METYDRHEFQPRQLQKAQIEQELDPMQLNAELIELHENPPPLQRRQRKEVSDAGEPAC